MKPCRFFRSLRAASLALLVTLLGVGSAPARAETAQAKLRVRIELVHTSFANEEEAYSQAFRLGTKQILRITRWENPSARRVELVAVRDTDDPSADLANSRALVLVDGRPFRSLFLTEPSDVIPPAEALQGQFEGGAPLRARRLAVAARSFVINYDFSGHGPIAGTVLGLELSSVRRRSVSELLLYGKRRQALLGSVKQPIVAGETADTILIGTLTASGEKVVAPLLPDFPVAP